MGEIILRNTMSFDADIVVAVPATATVVNRGYKHYNIELVSSKYQL